MGAPPPVESGVPRVQWELRVLEGVALATCCDSAGFVDGLDEAVLRAALRTHPLWLRLVRAVAAEGVSYRL